MKQKEVWRDIKDYEGLYQVSNHGNVKSLKYGKNRILKPALDSVGYYMVNLCNGKFHSYSIHKLVAIAFLNHKPCGYKIVVDHKDFNKTNNHLSNLRLISARENTNQIHLKSTSKYCGVSWQKVTKKWRAFIRINNKNKNLGSFNDELEASNAYQLALSKLKIYE